MCVCVCGQHVFAIVHKGSLALGHVSLAGMCLQQAKGVVAGLCLQESQDGSVCVVGVSLQWKTWVGEHWVWSKCVQLRATHGGRQLCAEGNGTAGGACAHRVGACVCLCTCVRMEVALHLVIGSTSEAII